MTARLDRLDALPSAARYLDEGRPDELLDALDALPDDGGAVGRALLMVTRGLQAEAEGRTDDAAELMERAFGLGPALPAAALRALVAYFRRSGRPVLANHAFLMLQVLDPGSLEQSVRELPSDELARYATWGMRASWWAREQDLYGLAPFKAALRERLGPEGAAVVLAGTTGPQGARRAVRRPLTPLIEQARAEGLELEELIAAGPVRSSAVRVFGQPSEDRDGRRGRALFRCVLADVVVTGRSGILLTGERALMDVQDDELERRPHDLSVDPLVAAADGSALLLLEPADRAALPRLPEAVWLGGVHSVAFGHWIIEFLPKVWAQMTRPGFGRVPLLVDARMPAQHLEAVRLFAGGDNPVHVLEAHESVRVERLWVASALSYLPVGPLPAPPGPRTRIGLDDAGFRRLMGRVAPALEAIDTSGSPARVYLARKASQHRRLANAAEVEARLVAAGFEVCDPAELTFAEQLRLVRGADWIVGPSGSALLNGIFGRPGLRIGALVPFGLPDVAWLVQACQALGIDITALVGEVVSAHPRYRWMSDYRIDIDLVEAFLEQPPAHDELRIDEAPTLGSLATRHDGWAGRRSGDVAGEPA